MKKLTIDLSIYKAKLYVWLCTVEEAEKEYKRTWYAKQNHTTYFQEYGGKCLYVDGVDPIIWIDSRAKKSDLIGCFSHEVFHAITYLLKDRGFILVDESGEAYSYLIEYVMGKIFNSNLFKK